MSLPIESIQSDFLTTISEQDVIVTAATGSGKSTQLPIWAASQGKVLVVEPRRIACTSLAEYVAHLCKTELGGKVGYAIRFETVFDTHTDIVFVTPGVALRWYFEDKLAAYSHIVLDEFHERRWDMDLLLALLKQHAQHRLILTSATLNAHSLSRYLNAPILHSEGNMYPVEEDFIAKDQRAMPTKDRLTERVVTACQQAQEDTDGDILVFLPGKGEIIACASALKPFDAVVVQLYSGCSKQNQQLALSKQMSQRIILATNVAETSLTIPNVTCVIDSGLERRTHLRNGKTVLGLDAIGRDSAKQRLGRAGRTQAGICIRLYGQFAPLIERTPPEIQRESLTELVLAAGCAAQGVDSLPFIDSLPDASKQRALTTLHNIGAIDNKQCATELGKLLYPLPVDAELGFLIANMPSGALKQAIIDLIAVISVPARVYQLPTHLEQIEQLNLLLPNHCDIELAIAIVRDQVDGIVHIEPEALMEAKQFSEQLREAFSLPSLEKAASYDRNALITAIAKARPEWVFVKRQNRRGGFGNGKIEVSPSNTSRINENTKAMLVLDTFALAGKGSKQAMTMATLAAPLPIKMLASQEIGELIFLEAYIDQGTIFTTTARQYAGVELSVFSSVAKGEMLIDACTYLIKKGELFEGLYYQLSKNIASHQLYFDYLARPSNLPTACEFIRAKLVELGVESQEDIQLIEAEDFSFQEVDSWELDRFIEKHPLNVTIPELKMQVTYFFKAKRVLLEHLEGKRKDAPKKWELPNFSGFKVQYKKASKVVDIK
ncbi:DEAD/DEAH box helicase [Pseudoalteromonas luteoviolacea]|uniref:DEAD/DEAH box helicase n=1 Tax=Pseudoalteromonas luteoviolacea TaxID=43657 RepID=UPI001B38F16B|nr:DEAD/DEAH box helicase [Pseudoalteromonas luteoviolacea]MBQ4836211.1 ATP-dependent RNA helicase [Pseudoalteromonas luteoviolacea]